MSLLVLDGKSSASNFESHFIYNYVSITSEMVLCMYMCLCNLVLPEAKLRDYPIHFSLTSPFKVKGLSYESMG